MTLHMTWPGPDLELFAAAEEAMRQLPPAFPLEATVAVNPWLGQTGEDRLTAAARMERVGGGALFTPRTEIASRIASGEITKADLAAAAAEHGESPEALAKAAETPRPAPAPVPCLADIAARQTGVDWPELIEERIGLWAAAQFDRGQAFWPAPGQSAWPSWRAFAARDLTPALAGLPGYAARIAESPSHARAAFAEACAALDLAPEAAPGYFHRLLVTLSGWGQMARHLSWTAERDGGRDDTLFEMLTLRLTWEVALLEAGGAVTAEAWAEARARFAAPLVPDAELSRDAALQVAYDLAAERRLVTELAEPAPEPPEGRPALQAAFCIDVRSEVLRRALEAADPGLRTKGFAGFFGLAVKHAGHASDLSEARAPILLNPGVTSATAGEDLGDRIHLRAIRAWGRFKRAAVSAFAFVEAAGPLYVGKLIRDGLGQTGGSAKAPAPVLDLPLADRIASAAQILGAMSLTRDFARLVLICGHGATVTNAPHASALQCGACGGHAGDVNAALLAGLLNEPEVRAGLAETGIAIPEDTWFLAGLHDTVSDQVTLFDDALPASHAEDAARLRKALAKAGTQARTERALSLPRGAEDRLAARGKDWSELRPEWGLAGCRAFVAAPRARTAGRDLGGQVFLHDYDASQDPEAQVLELILSAPVVVASWIALQYHGSSVAPETFGAGNKLLHNVVGGIGVLEGNGGALRAGLPRQSLHDGSQLRHGPSRLQVVVEAPQSALTAVLERQPQVRALFDNGWLSLIAMDGQGRLSRRDPDGGWTALDGAPEAERQAA
ncbi:DUF2309 domain-containing protein [Roseivivax sp. GX 12232]|uniref:YbcC family protein n=1 Tax=Roseivivax sp. GX 12232 TaxID=2900547 RepID=UPI001E443425|nr:DUF2309 domain-containing protein [Roseivivax sp. GX 12232]MCE0505399.1 DUF2309 domain-containing protein [Roseivivax sp. GX 12232]